MRCRTPELSRRALLALAGATLPAACAHAPQTGRVSSVAGGSLNPGPSIPVYVGGGAGVRGFELRVEPHQLSDAGRAVAAANYGALSPDGRTLYVCASGEDEGQIHVLRCGNDGRLAPLQTIASGGVAPTHLAVDPSGRFVVVANFRSDRLTTFPIGTEGHLQPASGAVATGRRPHQVCFGPDGRHIFVPHRDDDTIGRFQLDLATGAVEEAAGRVATYPRPRHMTFHPSGRAAYVIHEGEVAVATFVFKPGSHTLEGVTPASSRHGGGAHVLISPDGRFLYASVRSEPAGLIAFRVDPSTLQPIEIQTLFDARLAGPRDFDIEPTGRVLLLGSQTHDALVSLPLNVESGRVEGMEHIRKGVGGAMFVLAATPGGHQSQEDLQGAIDLHCHTGPDILPRELNDGALVQAAAEAGMRAVVLKSHVTATADRAALAMQASPGLEVFGGVALNLAVGGLNPHAVAQMAKMEGGRGRIVWLPTFDAPRIPVMRGRRLLPALEAILDLVASHDLILATGHLPPSQALFVLEAARKRGVRRLLVTHALSPPVSASVAVMREMVNLGAFLEFVQLPHVFTEPGEARLHIEDTAAAIRQLGADQVVLASDLGRRGYGRPTDGLRAFIRALRAQGIAQRQIQTMTRENPARVLGLEQRTSSPKRIF